MLFIALSLGALVQSGENRMFIIIFLTEHKFHASFCPVGRTAHRATENKECVLCQVSLSGFRVAFRDRAVTGPWRRALNPRAVRGTTNPGQAAAGKDGRRDKHEVTAKKLLLCSSIFVLSLNESPQSRF